MSSHSVTSRWILEFCDWYEICESDISADFFNKDMSQHKALIITPLEPVLQMINCSGLELMTFSECGKKKKCEVHRQAACIYMYMYVHPLCRKIFYHVFPFKASTVESLKLTLRNLRQTSFSDGDMWRGVCWWNIMCAVSNLLNSQWVNLRLISYWCK